MSASLIGRLGSSAFRPIRHCSVDVARGLALVFGLGQGYGRQKGHTEIYRGAEYAERFLPKIKVEIACLSNQVDKVIETIISSAKSGKIGDGKIFVYGLDHVVRIRTGETDTDAI